MTTKTSSVLLRCWPALALASIAALATACNDDQSADEADSETETAGDGDGDPGDGDGDPGDGDGAPGDGDGAPGDGDGAPGDGDGDGDGEPGQPITLTILHNNDGESQLIDAGAGLEDFGGVDRFVAKVAELRAAAEHPLVLSSGDNFLAGPEFGVSLDAGAPFYDSVALDAVGYDAICIGNHDFDFGPQTLADFIAGFEGSDPAFLSANLDFAGEPALQALVDDGTIAAHTVVELGGVPVGVIGATTPMLPFISSPGGVVVETMVAEAVLDEVAALEAEGVAIIVLISHLQSIEEDLALAATLDGVDLMIAGGGDEVLANDGDLLVPGDEEEIYGPYPMMSDNGVPVVTTKGGYRYVGRLIASFDADGELVDIAPDSGLVRVAGGEQRDAIAGDPAVFAAVVEPLLAALASLDMDIVGDSEVELDGVKAVIRTQETNEGDLIADALLWQAQQLAGQYGAATPDIAIQNAGGIRNDSLIPAGPISVLDTFDMVPFANFVVVVEGVSPAELEFVLENAYSRVEFVDGRFAQIAGFSVVYDPQAQGLVFDAMGNVMTPGERIVEVTLADDTKIIENGAPAPGAPNVDIATINFLATGGDQYDFGDAGFVALGVTYQQALASYVEDGLAGLISAADYPVGGAGRITTTP